MNSTQEIKDIVSDISEWLKFAEAKHVTLVASGIALLAICVDKFGKIDWKIITIIIGSFISLIPSIIAQIPLCNQSKFLIYRTYKHYSKRTIEVNHIFYLSIFIRTQEDREKLLQDYYCIFGADSKNILFNDYLSQALSLAQVASIKYFLFI